MVPDLITEETNFLVLVLTSETSSTRFVAVAQCRILFILNSIQLKLRFQWGSNSIRGLEERTQENPSFISREPLLRHCWPLKQIMPSHDIRGPNWNQIFSHAYVTQGPSGVWNDNPGIPPAGHRNWWAKSISWFCFELEQIRGHFASWGPPIFVGRSGLGFALT